MLILKEGELNSIAFIQSKLRDLELTQDSTKYRSRVLLVNHTHLKIGCDLQ